MLDAAGLSYEVDPTLVRGLDYYTRTLFEFTSDALGAQSGVAGGGRYDRLVEQLGGPSTPGMGWAAGVERILLAGEPPAVRAGPRRAVRGARRRRRARPAQRLRAARPGPLGGAEGADGARWALAERTARPGRLARRPLRGDRRQEETALRDMEGGNAGDGAARDRRARRAAQPPRALSARRAIRPVIEPPAASAAAGPRAARLEPLPPRPFEHQLQQLAFGLLRRPAARSSSSRDRAPPARTAATARRRTAAP